MIEQVGGSLRGCCVAAFRSRKLKVEVTPLAVYLDGTVADTETELGNVVDEVGLGKLSPLQIKRRELAIAVTIQSNSKLQRCRVLYAVLNSVCAAEGDGRRKLKAELTPLAVYLDDTVADTETELGNLVDDVGLGKLQLAYEEVGNLSLLSYYRHMPCCNGAECSKL